MIPTIEFTKQKFEDFNKLIFHSELPLPSLRIGTARTQLGSMMRKTERHFMSRETTYSYRLTLSRCYDISEREWEDVIIHEMIHYYIFLKNLKDTSAHGKMFRELMQTINTTYGRHISISRSSQKLGKQAESKATECDDRMNADTTEDGPIPATGMRRMSHFFCIAELQNGQWGVCVVARTRMFQMWKAIPKAFRTKNVRWFWSMNTLLNRYPKSIKPALYKISKEDVDLIVPASTELMNSGHTIMPKNNWWFASIKQAVYPNKTSRLPRRNKPFCKGI